MPKHSSIPVRKSFVPLAEDVLQHREGSSCSFISHIILLTAVFLEASM